MMFLLSPWKLVHYLKSLTHFIFLLHFQIKFVRSGDLAHEKAWFLYFVGFCILLESIFTDVLVMNWLQAINLKWSYANSAERYADADLKKKKN